MRQTPNDFFNFGGIDYASDSSFPKELQWFWSTTPDLTVLGDADLGVAQMDVDFETAKRATMIRLALEAYRLDHGQLPDSLDQLVGAYFDELPTDPYSCREFVYFPSGIPQPSTEDEKKQLNSRSWFFWYTDWIIPEVPCIWSPGANLRTITQTQSIPGQAEADGSPKEGAPIIYYVLPNTAYPYQLDSALPRYAAWARGWWFPIPEQQK